MPNRFSSSSVLPEPSSPATPKISPLSALNETPCRLAYSELKLSTLSKTPLGLLCFSGYRFVSSRPTISLIISFIVSSFARLVAIHFPSRIIVTSSDMRRISSILCEIYIMPHPLSRNIFIIRKRCSTSSSVREEVGSSKTMIFELYETALAISTICLCETDIVLIIVFGLTSIFKS